MEEIKIIDKDTKETYTYILKENAADNNKLDTELFWAIVCKVVEVIGKLIFKLLRFSLYIVISLLELLIKVIKALLFTNYRPFEKASNSVNSVLDRIANRKINKYKEKFATDNLARHQYNIQRSEEFQTQYKQIQMLLKECSENNITIDDTIYRDIISRMNIIIVEAEKKALEEGFSYCKETKYKLDDEEAYNEYIKSRVMRGM